MKTTHIENHEPLVVCLHASASSSRQWKSLEAMLAGQVRTIAPDLIGYGKADVYKPGTRFDFRQEVDGVLRQIEQETGKTNGPLHLVGHSYGGAAALQLALMYPERVASVTVYEPVQFLMLFEDGLRSNEAQEILAVWREVKGKLNSPLHRRSAAKRFIEYWSGKGTWRKIPFSRRRRLARLVPKVAAEFEAILSANVSADDFAKLDIPVRLICGTKTRSPASRVSEVLANAMPRAEKIMVEGARHMEPTTHAQRIDPLFAEHVLAALGINLEVAA